MPQAPITKQLAAWERVVQWVEDDPETFLFDEYDDALGTRDALARRLEQAATVTADTMEQVHTLDKRFQAATRPTSVPIRRGDARADELGWWWSRVPHELAEEFEEALKVLFPDAATKSQ